ncbi:MAG TPA: hypothetical protein VGY57_13190 [Vicinamibacterales bacterium]|jgi:hypothetical protein|nr:hypothetical protein [Vicinamibacterales bacterium]
MQLLAQTSTTTDNSAGAMAAMAAASGAILIAALVAVVIGIIIYFVILKRAGFNPWLSLLVLIPGLGQLIILIILVFTEWPVQREVKMLRAQLAGAGGTMPGAGYSPAAPPTYGTPLPPPGTPPATT